MTLPNQSIPGIPRRQFLQGAALGLGSLGLSSQQTSPALASSESEQSVHFAPRAKRVIFLFMAGGPSQLELLDHKPTLKRFHGTPIPENLIRNDRFAFIKGRPNLAASSFRFRRHGESGAEISELLPHLAKVSDDIAIVRSLHTDAFNHDPAVMFLNSGSTLTGRPALGAWLNYGLGSENQQLPGFVVLASGASEGPPVGYHHWTSGFLPTTHQGVRFRSHGDPVLFASSPPGVTRKVRRQTLDALRDLNKIQFESLGDPEIITRIKSFELAFQMQVSVPELTHLAQETDSTLQMYGAEVGQTSFANNCLLARRMVERGVRFVQLYHRHWDHHGFNSTDQNVMHALPQRCREIDRPAAALLTDLKQRGLLDETLVVWGGEFGRTPMVQGTASATRLGRDHHPDAFSVWLAGGGVRSGITLGTTDDLGYHVAEDPVHVHDLHATILHLMGIDHLALTHRHQGRDFRLTDVAGEVVTKLIA
ncbi:MAG: DUF1501 domain-containing protein [Pirellulaceae bacterium]|nr:DUF1501 domain-containing protein [Pirellulaceae bacterium]